MTNIVLPDALAELREQHRWVCWKYERSRTGKLTKVPYQPSNVKASTDDSSTWSFYNAVTAVADTFNGIGFVLTDSDVAAFDLDKCRDPATGTVEDWAETIVARADSYAEVTPSGTGLRIIGRGDGEEIHRKLKVGTDGASCEIYRKATRYITVTGTVYRDAPLTNIDAVIDAVIDEFGVERRETGRESPRGATELPPMLESLLSIVGNGAYPSRSELLFAFITGAMRAGVSDDAIVDACLNTVHDGCGIFEHCEENGGREYVERQLAHARERTTDGDLVLDPKDPMRSARELVARRYIMNGKRTLHRHRGAFWSWTNSYYLLADDEVIESTIWEFLERAKQRIQVGEDRWLTLPFRPNRNRVGDVAAALGAVCQLDSFIEPPSWLIESRLSAKEFLACGNGLLHLPTGKLYPPSSSYFNLSASEVIFNPTAPKPVQWLAFLKQLFGDDQEQIDLLQDEFGYIISPDTSQQKILLIIGPKRSGKGTIARILSKLIGRDSVAGPTMSSLSETFGLEPLITKPLAIVSDARIGVRTDKSTIAERLLSISGEDTMTVARKFKSAWHGRLMTRFIIITNELPSFSDGSGALASRFIALVLTKSFFGKEDPALTDKLATELPSILNWSIEGYRRLRRRGHFVQPQSSQEAIDEIEMLAAPVKAFIRELCETGPSKSVPIKRRAAL
jgi:P4 family phage/plasmid primase-like protien